MNASTPADPKSALMLAWNEYKTSEEFANSKRWAEVCRLTFGTQNTVGVEHPTADGSYWAMFMAGFFAGAEASAKFAEGGRFLHDDAPTARFGREVAAAIRRNAQPNNRSATAATPVVGDGVKHDG